MSDPNCSISRCPWDQTPARRYGPQGRDEKRIPMTPTKRSDDYDETDQLLVALQGLTATPKKGWRDQMFDHYAIAEGPIGRCFVVSSHAGVRHVFATAEFDDDPEVL